MLRNDLVIDRTKLGNHHIQYLPNPLRQCRQARGCGGAGMGNTGLRSFRPTAGSGSVTTE